MTQRDIDRAAGGYDEEPRDLKAERAEADHDAWWDSVIEEAMEK